MERITYREAKQFLERQQNQYVVSRALFLDCTGGRTNVIFELKKRSPLNRGELPHCEHTFRELYDLLETFHKTSPDGRIDFSENGLGLRIAFIIKAPQISLQTSGYKTHTIDDARALEMSKERSPGSKTVSYDQSMGRTRLTVQLDSKQDWFLIICFDSSSGALVKYILYEAAGMSESYYEFKNEAAIREKIYRPGDENRYIDELFIRYIAENSGFKLYEMMKPFFTAQFHYD